VISSVGEERGVLSKAPRFFVAPLRLTNLISPPPGMIGAPGPRLSGDVPGARTLPRTMWRNPVMGYR